jgi:MFS family permease
MDPTSATPGAAADPAKSAGRQVAAAGAPTQGPEPASRPASANPERAADSELVTEQVTASSGDPSAWPTSAAAVPLAAGTTTTTTPPRPAHAPHDSTLGPGGADRSTASSISSSTSSTGSAANSAAAHARHPFRSPRLALYIAAFGTLLVVVDYTSPLTTMPPVASALQMGTSAQTWVLTGMLIGVTALLLTAGSAADDFGRKRIFTGGVALLLVSTVLSGVATDSAIFIAGRVLQGAAAAAVMAPSLGLIGKAFPTGHARVRALGVWGASVGLGIALGPIYAALVERGAGWRAVYLILAAICVPLIFVAVSGLTESRGQADLEGLTDPDEPATRLGRLLAKFDPLGVITLGGGASCVIAGLSEGRHGWGKPDVLVLLVVGVLLLALFAVVEHLVTTPMLDPALFRSPGFIASSSGALFTGLAIIGLMSYLPTVLQSSLGESPLTASGVLAIWSGLSAFFALQARHLSTRLNPITQVAVSLLLCGAGEAALAGMHAGSSWVHLAPGLAVAGVGSGVLNAALARLAVSSVPTHRTAMGSGANNSARYLGSALGVAIAVTVVGRATSSQGPSQAMAVGANHAVLIAAGFCLIGAAIAVWARIAEARLEASAAVAGSAFEVTGASASARQAQQSRQAQQVH